MAALEATGFNNMLGQLNRMMRGSGAPAPAMPAAAVPAPASPVMGSDQFTRSAPSGSLQLYSQGPEVAAVQAKLISLGYLSGTPDGLYNPGTAQAIWYFQQENGRIPNGNCDASDMAMMDLMLSGRVPRRRPTPAPLPPAAPAALVHQVRVGENLSDLAQLYLGDAARWPELLQLNRELIPNPNDLPPGLVLRLPAGTQPPLSTLAPQTLPPTMGDRSVEVAKQFLGVPYVWGGTTPRGFDCSGLMQYVFRAMGTSIPRVAADQFRAGQSVEKRDLRPGDAVFFRDTGGRKGITHVGMYIGNGQFLQAPKTGDVVKISDLNEGIYASNYAGARRYMA